MAPLGHEYPLDFALNWQIAPTVMPLTAADNHLDVMICVTTQVLTHCWFDHVYRWPLAQAHWRMRSAIRPRVGTLIRRAAAMGLAPAGQGRAFAGLSSWHILSF